MEAGESVQLQGKTMKIASTSEVLDRHLQSFEEHDVDALLADYSPDAVFFVPTGPLKGQAAIKPLFQALISEFLKPGASFKMHHRCVDGDHAYILWSAETEDNWYEFATDTFVVRNGKIVAQSFAAKIRPKS
jgi:ketosteroid isomerase-like protein